MSKKSANSIEKPKRSFLDWIKANKNFVVALCVILALMITAFILSQTIPAGYFEKISEDEYRFVEIEKEFPFWKFLLSPFLLFGTDAGKSVAIIVS
ncbi:MAG: hypothetical protein MJ199_01565, partial [Bacilli bacterium]|nr:hypothetical protein [Bacilli bacterium]